MAHKVKKPRLMDKNGKVYSELKEVEPPLRSNETEDNYLSPPGLLETFYTITDTLLWDDKGLQESDKILRLLYPIFKSGDYTGYDEIGGWRLFLDSKAWFSDNWGALRRAMVREFGGRKQDLDFFLEINPDCFPTYVPVSLLASFILATGRLPTLRETRNPEQFSLNGNKFLP